MWVTVVGAEVWHNIATHHDTIPGITLIPITMTSRLAYTIEHATGDDIAAMATLTHNAFLDDTHTLLKSHWKGEYDHRDGMKSEFERLMTNPKVDMLVAKLDSREIVGFINWIKRYPDVVPTKQDTSSATPVPPPPPPPATSDTLTIKELGETTSAAMGHFMSALMPEGARCRIIHSMSVAPEYQGKGIGGALVRWGTDKADEDGVYCLVSSSMDGYHVYEKAGFVEVGRQDLCLDDYAQGVRRKVKNERGEDVEQHWGRYIWRWMRRDPK